MAAVVEAETMDAARSMIPVGWLAPALKCWDSNIIQLLTNKNDKELYPTGLQFRHFEGYPPPHEAEGTVLCIPGRYYSDHTDKINEALSSYRWVLGIITSDEEGLFDYWKIPHRNAKFWIQTPRSDRDYGDSRLFGVGFPPHFNDLPRQPPDKIVQAMLSAQNTHGRRREAFDALENTRLGVKLINETEGFTRGMSPAEYADAMCQARVAPAPSGAVSPDSFRLWEALAAHCIPIADAVSPIDGPTEYWSRIFDTVPFPVITDYADLPGWVEDLLEGWPANINRITAAWMHFKRNMARALVSDLRGLGALPSP